MNETFATPSLLPGSQFRTPDHPVDSQFVDRWSPRAMSGAPLSQPELDVLFEAARWAPSASNLQPWRVLYAHRDGPHWQSFFDLLSRGNREWAGNAAVLLLFLSQRVIADGQVNRSHGYDTGAAWMSLALQGARMGLVVHGMGGFNHDGARQDLKVPDDYAIESMAAIGHPGDPANLSEARRAREKPNDRRPIVESVREGLFAFIEPAPEQ